MLYASVIVSALVAVSCIIGTYFIAAKLSQVSSDVSNDALNAHGRTLETLERIHERNLKLMSDAQDRVMSHDFQTFKAYADDEQEGGFEEPELVGAPFSRMEIPLPGGRVKVADDDHSILEEMELLKEDFPPGWDDER